jgi:hypothetical protein
MVAGTDRPLPTGLVRASVTRLARGGFDAAHKLVGL